MAELIPWNERYSIGCTKIDEQHKHLIKLINVLHAAKEHGKSQEYIEKILNELVNYADFHFVAEESILEKAFFPKLDGHKAEHNDFRTWLENSRKRLPDPKLKKDLPNEVLNYLKSWLISHIVNSDKKNSYYLCKGAK